MAKPRIRLRTLLAMPILAALGLFVWDCLSPTIPWYGSQAVSLSFIVCDAGDRKPIPNATIRINPAYPRAPLPVPLSEGRTDVSGAAVITREFDVTGESRGYRKRGDVLFRDCWLEVEAAGYATTMVPLEKLVGRGRNIRNPTPPPAHLVLPRGKTPDPGLGEFVGEFVSKGWFGRSYTLTILPDGRFAKYMPTCFGMHGYRFGNVRRSGFQLTLTEAGPDPNATAIDQARLFYEIREGNRLHLVTPNAMASFCNWFNLAEPSLVLSGPNSPGSWFRRDLGPDQGIAEPQGFPDEWKRRLRAKPVVGSIVKLLPEGQMELDLGNRDGIWDGMELALIDGSSQALGVVKILSVADHSSTAEVDTLAPRRNNVVFPEIDASKLYVGQRVSSRLPEACPKK